MTAQEAREKTLENITNKQSVHMTVIRNNISVAVSKGSYSCTTDRIAPEIKKLLEEEGYSVTIASSYVDGGVTTISWK